MEKKIYHDTKKVFCFRVNDITEFFALVRDYDVICASQAIVTLDGYGIS